MISRKNCKVRFFEKILFFFLMSHLKVFMQLEYIRSEAFIYLLCQKKNYHAPSFGG